MKLKDMPVLPLVLIAVMIAAGAWAYPSLPARIPTHWGIGGRADGWSAKSVLSVFMGPLAAIVVYALFWVMPYLDPRRRDLLDSGRVYVLLLEMVTGLFAVLHATMLAAAHDTSVPVGAVVTVAVGVVLIVLGSHLGRVKPNWTLGIRYAWTLSDDTVWTRTNTLGGRLMMLAGTLGILGIPLRSPWDFLMLIAPMLALVPVTYVYSWRLFRRLHAEGGQPPQPAR